MSSNPADAPSLISWGRKLALRAEETPDEVAVRFVRADDSERELTWQTLDGAGRRFATHLSSRGVGAGDRVVVGLPRSPEHMVTTFGAWKLGACVIPLREDLPEIERAGLVQVIDGRVVVADWPELPDAIRSADVWAEGSEMISAEINVAPIPASGIASGGSTGRPKLILSRQIPGGAPEGMPANPLAAMLGMTRGAVFLSTSPLYHGLGFNSLYLTLLDGVRPVVVERFDAKQVLDLIERHRVNVLVMIPTMMQRLLRVPGIEDRDLSSVTTLLHTGAICPEWVKRRWIDLLSPEKVIDVYGSAEQIGVTLVRGDEWLEHPGTIGKGMMTEVRVLDDDRNEVPRGTVGELFMRMQGVTEITYQYAGAERGPTTSDAFASVGDLGWMDDDDYVYIADRRTDLIISGGANVYPAEVEAAVSEHPVVADVVVVGKPDEEWGKRVHAIVEVLGDLVVSADELDAWCRERLAPYKAPKTYEFVEQLPRTEAGKVNRSALALGEHDGVAVGQRDG